jgi:hypothetical protein
MPILIDTDPVPINYMRVKELSEEFMQLWSSGSAYMRFTLMQWQDST